MLNELETHPYIIQPCYIYDQYNQCTVEYRLLRARTWFDLELIAQCPREADAELLRAALLDLPVLWAGDVPSGGYSE